MKPQAERKEKLGFMVEIKTPETENSAYAKDGTKLGFGVQLRTAKALLTAYAPFGYKFVLLDPSITLRDSETLAEIPGKSKSLKKPRVSPDGSILTLSIKNPSLGKRYWIHYRFEKCE